MGEAPFADQEETDMTTDTQIDEISEQSEAQLDNVTGGAKAKTDPIMDAIYAAAAAILGLRY